jgi:ATP-binding cassette subfamily A (ABC1) protein 3
MAFGAILMSMWEGNDVGIQWSNIHESASPDDTLTMLTVIIMFIVDTFLYLITTWYISSVFPGEYGIPLKWYFPFTKSYWCGTDEQDISSDQMIGYDDSGFENYNKDDSRNKNKSTYLEDEPRGLKSGIKIIDLSKSFDGGKTYAVNNLNLNTYNGQITALLGHNGAGIIYTVYIYMILH